jgi:dTDP-glucose 4,6-dehydratase
MILVTGGAGFIGSNFVRYLIEIHREPVVVIDKLTYAGDLANLKDLDPDMLHFVGGDIANDELVLDLLLTYHPRGIVHFAAESHVDRSIDSSMPFVDSNVVGTVKLLDATKQYLKVRDQYRKDLREFRFHHVSTDEVYGSLGVEDPAFTEETLYAPRSPYSASKAASDHFVAAYGATHNIPWVLTNCSNNYGPRQHKEKLIPTVITRALNDEPIPVYGQGANIRDWIHVQDHCEALWAVFNGAANGERYNIGGKCQLRNIDIVVNILTLMNKPLDLITFVEDRLGHDFRYDIDNAKIERDFGWNPRIKLEDGLRETIEWYTNGK